MLNASLSMEKMVRPICRFISDTHLDAHISDVLTKCFNFILEPCPFSLAPNGTFAIGYGYNEEETVPGGTTYYGDDQIEYFEIEIPDHHKGEDGEGPCIGGWDYIMFANEGKRLQGTTHNSAITIDVETRTLIYVAEGVEGHSARTQYGQQFTHSSPYLTIRSATIGEIIRKFPGHMDASELIEIEKTIPAELNSRYSGPETFFW